MRNKRIAVFNFRATCVLEAAETMRVIGQACRPIAESWYGEGGMYVLG